MCRITAGLATGRMRCAAAKIAESVFDLTSPTYSMRLARVLVIVVALVPAIAASQQASSRITPAEIDGHLRFLSSDLLEGRAPATRGGRLAAEYIAAQLRIDGVEPGVGKSYFQPVPIDVVGARSEERRVGKECS